MAFGLKLSNKYNILQVILQIRFQILEILVYIGTKKLNMIL